MLRPALLRLFSVPALPTGANRSRVWQSLFAGVSGSSRDVAVAGANDAALPVRLVERSGLDGHLVRGMDGVVMFTNARCGCILVHASLIPCFEDVLRTTRNRQRMRGSGMLPRWFDPVPQRYDRALFGAFTRPLQRVIRADGAQLPDCDGEEGLDHGDVSNNDGDECFTDGPASSLFGTIGSGLDKVEVSQVRQARIGWQVREILTVRIRAQRSIAAIMTKTPPLNMKRSQAFLFGSICTFQNS